VSDFRAALAVLATLHQIDRRVARLEAAQAAGKVEKKLVLSGPLAEASMRAFLLARVE